jgi:hypothetical protein
MIPSCPDLVDVQGLVAQPGRIWPNLAVKMILYVEDLPLIPRIQGLCPDDPLKIDQRI